MLLKFEMILWSISFDHFHGKLTSKVTECLEKHNITTALVPASRTDILQPLDISVNMAAKTNFNIGTFMK